MTLSVYSIFQGCTCSLKYREIWIYTFQTQKKIYSTNCIYAKKKKKKLNLFHPSNSRGRFTTTLLTLSQCVTAWHQLTLCQTESIPRTKKLLTISSSWPWLWEIHTNAQHPHTNSYGDVLIHLSLTESLASDVECVTPWQETHCFIMEKGGGKHRLLSFKSISHTRACELRLGRWWYVCHRKWSVELSVLTASRHRWC